MMRKLLFLMLLCFVISVTQAAVIVDFDAAAGPANGVGVITVVLDIATDGTATLNSITGTGAGLPAAVVSGSVSSAPSSAYQVTLVVGPGGRQTGIGLVGVGNNHIDPGETMTFDLDIDAAPAGTAYYVTEMAMVSDQDGGADGTMSNADGDTLAFVIAEKNVRQAFDATPLVTTVGQGDGLSRAIELNGGTYGRYQLAAISIDTGAGVGGLEAITPYDGEVDVRNDFGGLANDGDVILNWTAAGDFVVVDYLVSMGNEDPNFPGQANLINAYGPIAPVSGAPVAGVTIPADQDPNGLLDITSDGTVPVGIATDTAVPGGYYWQVTANVYEPNYENAAQLLIDPNIPVYDIPSQVVGPYWNFLGELTTVEITSGLSPAVDHILPNPQTLEFATTAETAFTAEFTAGVAVDTVVFTLAGDTICTWDSGAVSGDAGYNIVVDELSDPKTATLEITVNGMDADASVGEAYEGEYGCIITLTNAKTDEATPAVLTVASKILAHRWSFNDTPGSTTVVDSIGGADGTIIDPNAPGNVTLNGSEAVFTTAFDETTGEDPNFTHYIDLPNGIVSAMGDNMTILMWFTTDVHNAWARVFDFGNTNGGEDAPTPAGTKDYVYFVPQRGTTSNMRFHGKVGGDDNNVEANQVEAGIEVAVACVWDGEANQMKLRSYLFNAESGKFELADSNTGANADGLLRDLDDVNCWLGRSNWAGDHLFDGKINELRIYDVPLMVEWCDALIAKGADDTDPEQADPCFNALAPDAMFDLDGSCVVDLGDIQMLAEKWLEDGKLSELYPESDYYPAP